MMRRYSFPNARHPLAPAKAALAGLCPKCRGVGKVVLLRRPLAADLTDVCPTCHGCGVVHK